MQPSWDIHSAGSPLLRLASLTRDFWPALNLDGLQRGGPFSTSEKIVPPDQPFMMITKEKQLHPVILDKFKQIPSGSYLVVVEGASHDSFTDGPSLVPSLLPLPNKADRILAVVRSYTLAFFDQILKAEPSPLLARSHTGPEGSIEVFPPG